MAEPPPLGVGDDAEPDPGLELPLPDELSTELPEDEPESLPLDDPELDELPLLDLFCLLDASCFFLLLEDDPDALPLSVLKLLLESEDGPSLEPTAPFDAAIAALTDNAKANAKDCFTNFIMISCENKKVINPLDYDYAKNI